MRRGRKELNNMLFNEEEIEYNKKENNLFSYPSIPLVREWSSFSGTIEVWKRMVGEWKWNNEILFTIEEKFNGINVGIFIDDMDNDKIKVMTRNYIYEDIESFEREHNLKIPEKIINYLKSLIEEDKVQKWIPREYIIFGELIDSKNGNKFMKEYEIEGGSIFVIFDLFDKVMRTFSSYEKRIDYLMDLFNVDEIDNEYLRKKFGVWISLPIDIVKGFEKLKENDIVRKVMYEKNMKSQLNKDIVSEGIVVRGNEYCYEDEVLWEYRIIFKIKQRFVGEDEE